MNIFLCIDDTDQLNGPGTGKLLQALCGQIESNGWGICGPISRHQLFVHDDIPYTSHNSSLCTAILIGENLLDRIIHYSKEFLVTNRAPGSDPGLCVAVNDRLKYAEHLIRFGQQTKASILSKKDAYQLADTCQVHLSEHGGTGSGIIGALAGVGLRISGQDGRFRGWYHLGRTGASTRVDTLISHPFIDVVMDENGTALPPDTPIQFGGDELKTVLKNHCQVLLVRPAEPHDAEASYVTLTKREVKIY